MQRNDFFYQARRPVLFCFLTFQVHIQEFHVSVRGGNAILTLAETMTFIREYQVPNRHLVGPYRGTSSSLSTRSTR
jgi:hypothetical protein